MNDNVCNHCRRADLVREGFCWRCVAWADADPPPERLRHWFRQDAAAPPARTYPTLPDDTALAPRQRTALALFRSDFRWHAFDKLVGLALVRRGLAEHRERVTKRKTTHEFRAVPMPGPHAPQPGSEGTYLVLDERRTVAEGRCVAAAADEADALRQVDKLNRQYHLSPAEKSPCPSKSEPASSASSPPAPATSAPAA